MKACDIDGCERKHYGRGWCERHYRRWRKHGDPLVTLTYSDPEDAFLARTEPIVGEPVCLIWTGYTNRDGYGVLSVNGRMVLAHRYSWTRDHGPIPDGLEVDHKCWERSCVNTEHLRLATHAENTRNLSGVRKNGGGLPRGVTPHGRGYRARVHHDGQTHSLGTFETAEQASQAASEARRIHFGIYAGNA